LVKVIPVSAGGRRVNPVLPVGGTGSSALRKPLAARHSEAPEDRGRTAKNKTTANVVATGLSMSGSGYVRRETGTAWTIIRDIILEWQYESNPVLLSFADSWITATCAVPE